MSNHYRSVTPKRAGTAREEAHAELDRLLDAMEFGLPPLKARVRLLDHLTAAVCEIAVARETKRSTEVA